MSEADKTNTPRILIVDDVPKNIQVLGSILMRKNYNIAFASNGTDAIELAESNDLDLILLDVMMPGIDGFETCTRLQQSEKTKDIPIIFMTALSDTSDKVKGFTTGAVDYITKPYEAEEVLARVETHLTIRRLQKDLQKRVDELEIRNNFIRRTFGRYVSEEVVAKLLESPDHLEVGGETRVVTILLSDLRGFSAIAEDHSPEDVVNILNNYLSTMTDVIMKYEGIIDEFIGDAILVIFGAPIKKDDHADRAVACAIEMQLAVEELNKEYEKRGYPEVQMGIGINTGDVVVGNIGSMKRAKYGVVGRNVNVASRIESYTVGHQILISEDTYNNLQGKLKTTGSVKVNPKGVTEPITIYNVTGIEGVFNVDLPVPKEIYRQMDTELNVRYIILDEKSADQTAYKGILTKASQHRAHIKTEMDIPLFSNMKLYIMPDCEDNVNCACYAKVIGKDEQNSEYEVHFTTFPQKVKDYFSNHIIQ